MLVKKNRKSSPLVFIIIFIIVFYYMLRVATLVAINNGIWKLEFFTIALNNIYKLNTPIVFTRNTLVTSMGVSFFVLMVYETYRLQNKKNIQENTYGSSDWRTSKDLEKKKDKNFENNIILTETEFISKNMKQSGMNKHILLIGRPGTGKSFNFFKPNLLNANRLNNRN